MDERKAVYLVLAGFFYVTYNVFMWLKPTAEVTAFEPETKTEITIPPILDVKNDTLAIKEEIKTKVIPLFIKNACSVLEIFTQKPPAKLLQKRQLVRDNNTITVIGITVFLLILLINAILEAIRVTEEENAKRKLNPDGERRQSLSEFANKKPLRRESSRFGLQLFQIAETFVNSDEDKKSRRQTRPYTRGESTNSYLSEPHRKPQEGSAPASISETPVASEPRLVKRQSVAKIIGARPVPMVRRSSFPALSLNPDIQALMLGHRQQSFDSDDEGDGRGRRVRLIRRF